MPELAVRPVEQGDEFAVADLINASARQLHGRDETTPEVLGNQWADAHTEAWVAVDGAEIVAYAGMSWFADESRFFLRLRFGSGGGADVLAVAEARARELARPGALLRAGSNVLDEARCRFFARSGYRVVRHWFDMTLDLRKPVADPVWPEGLAVRTFVPGEDDVRTYEADAESFEDHWDNIPLEYDRWRAWTVDRSDFDPSLWFLAVDGDEVAGISLCERSGAGEAGVGVVDSLGVRRRWRRRGIARALLLHSFRAMRGRGFHEARLTVDSANPTGALGLYEGVGMTVDRRFDTYEKAL